jgi:hypothetical protein
MNFDTGLREQGIGVNTDLVMQGLKDALAPICGDPDAT